MADIRSLFLFQAVAEADIFSRCHAGNFLEFPEKIGVIIEPGELGNFREVVIAAPDERVRIFNFTAVEIIGERNAEMLAEEGCEIGFVVRK